MNANWNYPTKIRIGAGRVHELPEVCHSLKVKTPLLVIDPGITSLAMTAAIVSRCENENLGLGLFSGFKSNPTGSNVIEGVSVYCAGSHDGIIALGGGSSLDVAKAIAVIAHQHCTLWELEDIGDNWLRANADTVPSIIAIPTTAGTGSEVGRAAVILNEQTHKKTIIFHPQMLPSSVILDPNLTLGLPPDLTAATGMDALAHNLEAFCSTLYHPMAEGIAIEGIRLIKNNLPIAVTEGSNLEARTHMLVASAMGATAFQRGLGAMHALAHPLGAVYDAHHGMLNAILMPYVLKANYSKINTRISRLASYLDLTADFDAFLDWILTIRVNIGIPHQLSAVIGDDHRLAEIAEMAVVDPSASTNPILHDARAYQSILQNAYRGEL